jgi:hypothetical protein
LLHGVSKSNITSGVICLCTYDRRNEKFVKTLGRRPLGKLTRECGKDIVQFSGFLMKFLEFLVGLAVEHDIVTYLGIIRCTLFVYHIWSAILKGISMKCSKEVYNKN